MTVSVMAILCLDRLTLSIRLLENAIAVSSCLRRSWACGKPDAPVVLFSEKVK
jgi:hypothetical protein